MSVTNWIEILQTAEIDLAVKELENIGKKIQELWKALEPICKQNTKDERPIKSDTDYESKYLQQRKLFPERYYNFAMGKIRIEIKKTRQQYYVRFCNWKPKGTKMISSMGWERTAKYENIYDTINIFEYYMKECINDETKEIE